MRAPGPGILITLAVVGLTACSPARTSADAPMAEPVPADPTSMQSTAPAPPDIAWSTAYQETFDDAQAASAWLWKGKFPPTISEGHMSYTTQAGQAGYTGIGADAAHVDLGGGADDDSLRTIRVTAIVSLEGIAAYGATCLDAVSKGGYPSPSMYALTVSSTGAKISKTVDDGPSETVATSDTGVLPDPFTGAITVTCAPVEGGYYLEVAIDDDVLLATVDTGVIPEGRNARLYDAAASVAEPKVSIDEVTLEVPTP